MTRKEHAGRRFQRDPSSATMRLRDLIAALRARHGSATALLQRIDPAIADELHAYAAHRNIDLMDFAADCLERLAADAADTLWQLGIERHTLITDDPETALVSGVLQTAVRSRLQKGQRLAPGTTVRTVFIGFSRSGHPYAMA